MSEAVQIDFFLNPSTPFDIDFEAFVGSLVAKGFSYMPAMGYSTEAGMFNEDTTLDEAISEVSKKDGWIPFSFKELGVTLSMRPHLTKTEPIGTIGIWVDDGYVFETSSFTEAEAASNAADFIEAARIVWNALPIKPVYGFGYSDFIDEGGKFWNPLFKDIQELNADALVANASWVDFYGSELIEKIGEEKLMSAPSIKTERFDGGVLVQLRALPLFSHPTDKYDEFKKFFSKKKFFSRR